YDNRFLPVRGLFLLNCRIWFALILQTPDGFAGPRLLLLLFIVFSISRCPDCSSSLEPVKDHARLGQGEGEKDADGIQRDQPAGVASECRYQNAGEDGEDDNAVGKDELVAA